jgi:type I restriction enzyme, S subunit
MVRKATGASYPAVSDRIVLESNIPLPPIAQQKRIAAILGKAEDLRSLRRQALRELDAIAQSIFLETFGDPEKNPKNWSISSLADLVAEFRYGTSNKSESHGKPALRIPNVVGGTLNLSDLKLVPVEEAEFKRLRLQSGDILFVRTNGNPDFVGRCAIFDDELVTDTGLPCNEFIYASYLIRARLHPETIIPIFLREFLLGKCGRKELRARCKTSAGQFNINIPSLSSIPVPIPPINLQQEFTGRLQAIEHLKATHRESLAHLDALFASLQHRAFRGEL